MLSGLEHAHGPCVQPSVRPTPSRVHAPTSIDIGAQSCPYLLERDGVRQRFSGRSGSASAPAAGASLRIGWWPAEAMAAQPLGVGGEDGGREATGGGRERVLCREAVVPRRSGCGS
jgi:hypothetical protein